ncbi:uncharacterized protein N7482_006294 [Penicillium canariense]|uniref:Amidase domain-containing protein n=1 Tax=Penicillium canariense TaxID=189055 RepID=A0A9W9LPA3_9EURO|nr:uncharacterized protein N7482_006294 [Penicillium canariense]KAJ5167513.1 hypothetical protein N7482_006294 [Penicillium canariense]
MGSTCGPIDVTELTISAFHAALLNETTTCAAVVHAYLDRIARYDNTLRSLICVNEDALRTATIKDEETRTLIKKNKPLPSLHGVPVILKDNFTTADLPTSAGVKALQKLRTTEDSEVVSRLREAGAIILAKANLHEFALHGTTTSSLGGQTLNPYDLTRTPGGSSGGTGAALAANLGLVGCGTDTVNSLRSPASACSIVGFRPSLGRVSGQGIVPVTDMQDTAGPMGRTLRIGILDAFFGLEDPKSDQSEELIAENALVQRVVHEAIASIEDGSDINLIHIDPASHADWRYATLRANADTQDFEFRERLDTFLQSPFISYTPHQSLKSIAESGEYDKTAVTETFTASLEDPDTFSLESKAYRARLDGVQAHKMSVQDCFDKNEIDALLYPHQRQLAAPVGTTVQPRRNGVLAALAGTPAICIPAGFSPPTSSAAQGVPIGLELMGPAGNDEELLDLAERIEGILQRRKAPNMNEMDGP